MPLALMICAAARLERCALAPAPSVRLTAVAWPFSGSARARRSAGSAETGGATSAVMTNFPLLSAAPKPLVPFSAITASKINDPLPRAAGEGRITTKSADQ